MRKLILILFLVFLQAHVHEDFPVWTVALHNWEEFGVSEK